MNPRSNISGSDYINADFVKVKSIAFANVTINEGFMIINRVDEKSWSTKHEKVDSSATWRIVDFMVFTARNKASLFGNVLTHSW